MSGINQSEKEGLRKRNVSVHARTSEEARQTVLQLNALEEKTAKSDSDKKTFGRTPDGTVFTVPETHDMVSQLLSPAEPKNLSDLFVIAVLALHILLLWLLPPSLKVPVFGIVFTFWRMCYNLGIGWLLQKQSLQNTMVRWAKKSKLFEKPENCPRPKLRAFVKRELETKVVKDYKFDQAPIEYNTWLVFRRFVDLILMCDFVSYSLFAIACSTRPVGETLPLTCARWLVGVGLFAFNLWVKLDAHRVVKDYAWYWGDFFFLVDQELTFDGVFEMAPHPMYSIGYVGFYGISLMAASHKVMFISIFAHAAQFAFLVFVENPHIERTYNSPPPRRQIHELPKLSEGKSKSVREDTADAWPNPASNKPSATHKLLGPRNMDLYRVTDSSVIIIQILLLSLTLVTSDSATYQAIFVANAVFWRLWYSIGIGYLLNRQSTKKKWTRHFLKFGESTGEAWRQWKGTYHMSMVLCYASFAAAAWKMYAAPPSWDDGLVLLKHTIGFSLIALQVWVATSIYDQLGEFGWFFGDFFFDHQPTLTYGGIYRFLNNPERVLGLAGVWGVALITNSKAIFALALLSHTLSLMFIQFVERPHMQKLYGQHLRQDSGLVRTLKRSLPPPLRQWQDGMDKMLGEALDTVEEFLDAARPRIEAGLELFAKDIKAVFSRYPARIAVTRAEPKNMGLDPDAYSIEVEGEMDSISNGQHTSHLETTDGSHLPTADEENQKPLMFNYGSPLRIKWTAPVNHSHMDWIGLYRVSDNWSRKVTHISSQSRWIATNPGEYDILASEKGLLKSDVFTHRRTSDGRDIECVSGEMLFAGDKLWWTQGVFEFRYHDDGRHNVRAISRPFEIRLSKFNEDDLDLDQLAKSSGLDITDREKASRHSIERALLPVVQNSFDRDPNIAPSTPQETFGGLVERDGKYARRVVYAIRQMFGIEFASEVVKADGKVENLAWRICEAKKILAPYSMSRSRGTTTPTEPSGK